MKNQEKSLPLATAALQASYGTADLLPIEFFKLHADTLREWMVGPVVRSFLSSGTTRADRSQSHFSEAGLKAYHDSSLRCFQEILSHFFANPHGVRGLSLIPPVAEWPDSSLAQMVAWIGAEQPLQYWDGIGPLPDEPVWVFGTAFHFVNLADDGVRVRLPQGSVVVETGGTKGRSRSVTRDELYDLIADHLGVPKNRIISEYGMCELASQAYDFVENPEGPELPLSERWFRFSAATPVSIIDRRGQTENTGEGTLVIHDNLRTDYPWPIRSEDMARVRDDGAFQLLGRVPMSPLKGCSMLAEDIRSGPAAAWTQIPPKKLEPQGLKARAHMVHEAARALARDESFWNEWRKSLDDTLAADWLQDDLYRSLPAEPADWIQAAEVARGLHCPGRWLIIPPTSHGFAALYPLFLGSVLGIDLWLRADAQDPMILILQKHLVQTGGFQIWDSHKRIGTDALPPVDAVMIYGSDETIASLAKDCPVPVQGFGSSLTVSLMRDDSLDTHSLWKDAFSLLQRGCMASRVVFLLQEMGSPSALRRLMTPVQPVGALPLGLELALEHGAFALRCQGLAVERRTGEGAPLRIVHSFDAKLSLDDYLIDRAMSLSLVLVPKKLWTEFAEWLPLQRNLHKIAARRTDGELLGLETRNLEITPPGTANAPLWNGLHQLRPLFGLGGYNK